MPPSIRNPTDRPAGRNLPSARTPRHPPRHATIPACPGKGSQKPIAYARPTRKQIVIATELEKFVAEVNPAHLVIGTDTEYEDEVRMFLERINDSMNEKQLAEVLNEIFCEMFNTPKENRNLDPYWKNRL